MAGYSGTPLIKKLGLKPGHVAQFIGAPKGYFKLLGLQLPSDPEIEGIHSAECETRVAE